MGDGDRHIARPEHLGDLGSGGPEGEHPEIPNELEPRFYVVLIAPLLHREPRDGHNRGFHTDVGEGDLPLERRIQEVSVPRRPFDAEFLELLQVDDEAFLSHVVCHLVLVVQAGIQIRDVGHIRQIHLRHESRGKDQRQGGIGDLHDVKGRLVLTPGGNQLRQQVARVTGDELDLASLRLDLRTDVSADAVPPTTAEGSHGQRLAFELARG